MTRFGRREARVRAKLNPSSALIGARSPLVESVDSPAFHSAALASARALFGAGGSGSGSEPLGQLARLRSRARRPTRLIAAPTRTSLESEAEAEIDDDGQQCKTTHTHKRASERFVALISLELASTALAGASTSGAGERPACVEWARDSTLVAARRHTMQHSRAHSKRFA